MADQDSKTLANASMNAATRDELDRAAKLLKQSIEALEGGLTRLQRDEVKRSTAVPRFERFGTTWLPKPHDRPRQYVWLRLKPEPRLTSHRDD